MEQSPSSALSADFTLSTQTAVLWLWCFVSCDCFFTATYKLSYYSFLINSSLPFIIFSVYKPLRLIYLNAHFLTLFQLPPIILCNLWPASGFNTFHLIICTSFHQIIPTLCSEHDHTVIPVQNWFKTFHCSTVVVSSIPSLCLRYSKDSLLVTSL